MLPTAPGARAFAKGSGGQSTCQRMSCCSCLRAVPDPPRAVRCRAVTGARGEIPQAEDEQPFCPRHGPAQSGVPPPCLGAGRAGQDAHPRPGAGSTAGYTAASCSPASARRRRLRCLPKPGGRAPLPATAPPGPPPSRCPRPPGSGRGESGGHGESWGGHGESRARPYLPGRYRCPS